MTISKNSELLEAKVLADMLKIQMLKNEDMTSLVELYNLLGQSEFFKVIDLLGGKTVTFPDSSYFKDTIETALCYIYRNVKRYDWDQIKLLIKKPGLNVQSMSQKIMQFSKSIEKMSKEVADTNGC